MARKQNQSAFEDLIDIVAMFPWWVGLILAVISYLWLHNIAIAPVVIAAQPGQVGAAISQSMYKGLATAGQYVLPMICVIGAMLSALGRWKRDRLFADVSASAAPSALNGMSWQEFEVLVGEAFRRRGYSVTETGGGGADGGIDLVLKKDGEKYLVQCKQWRALKVGVSIVRELFGVMAASGAVGGFVVTSGVFTAEAKSFAEGRNLTLIDGAELMAMIQSVRQHPAARPSQAAPAASQFCPKCGSAMTKRTAKQGTNTGKTFWGCSNFPTCRGIVPID